MDHNILDYGASADGRAASHGAIQQAIDAAHAAGGGRVVVPTGTYITGMLTLRSHVELHLEAGARLLAGDDAAAFPGVDQRKDSPRPLQVMLFADGAEDVHVTGPGVIDGGGAAPAPSWDEARELAVRPVLVLFRDCRNVRFENVSLLNSRNWTLHLKRCEQVRVTGVNIRGTWPNSDGIDPDGCRDVRISDCRIETGDDCIVIKSTEGDVCEDIVVSNCVLRTGHGALKLGTESLGTIRNVSMTNCIVHTRGHGVGFALYMKDGGRFEDIAVSNLILHCDSPFAILLDVTPRFFDEAENPGSIARVAFRNVIVHGPGRCMIAGTPTHPVRDVVLSDVLWHVTGPLDTTTRKPNGAARIRLDPDAPNDAVHPHALLARHVRGLDVSGWRVSHANGLAADRGLAWLHDVSEARVQADGFAGPAGIDAVVTQPAGRP